MTLQVLSLRNFKCFRSLQLPLAPLTVLTGFNAAGKSTALQSLLLLAQTLRREPAGRALPLNGTMVRLGTAAEVAFRTGEGRIMFGVESEGWPAVWEFAPTREYGDRHLSLVATEFNGKRSETKTRLWPKRLENSGRSSLAKIRDIVFLGASRRAQAEVFPAPDDGNPVHADVGSEGEFAPWWYVRLVDDEIDAKRRHPSEKRVTIRGQVDAYLSDLFPGTGANAEAIFHTSLTRLDLRMGRGGDWLRPANIGYGVSYAFPLLVTLATAKRNQVIIVDSPEAHLHPAAQSTMGQILGRFSAAGVQLLIETHSDHILSGIRLSVQKGIISAESVVLHFFEKIAEDGTVNIISPKIDSYGNIDSWPEGFFDQAEKDLSVLSGW